MGLDIRLPIGLMFTIAGAIITIYGFVTKADQEMYARSLGYNVNISMGAIMLVFGLAMIIMAFIGKKNDQKQNPQS